MTNTANTTRKLAEPSNVYVDPDLVTSDAATIDPIAVVTVVIDSTAIVTDVIDRTEGVLTMFKVIRDTISTLGPLDEFTTTALQIFLTAFDPYPPDIPAPAKASSDGAFKAGKDL